MTKGKEPSSRVSRTPAAAAYGSGTGLFAGKGGKNAKNERPDIQRESARADKRLQIVNIILPLTGIILDSIIFVEYNIIVNIICLLYIKYCINIYNTDSF